MADGIERDGLFEATCPYDAGRLAVTATWRSVAFVHWGFDPEAVSPLLPADVGVDLYGGRAWAGYQVARVSHGPARLSVGYHEVRVVVAVVDHFGVPGTCYLSVDTDRAIVAAAQRRWLNLASYEAEARFAADGDQVEYWTKRPDGTTARLKLTVGPEITATDVDRFLTARWRILLPPSWWDSHHPDGNHRQLITAHDPWILHRASIEFFDDEVLVAAGLPPAAGAGQALWSPGTEVRIGLNRL